MQPLAQFLDKTAFEGVEKIIYRILGQTNGSKLCLSMTAGFEHYTALLAEVAFENSNEFKHLPKEMQQLWFWHAAEEIEHRAVAYNLLQYIDDDPLLKNAGFTLATVLLFFYAIVGQTYFVIKDQESKPSEWPLAFLDYFESLLNPMTKKFLGNMADYLKADFHPNQMNIDYYAEVFFSGNSRYTFSKSTI